MRNLYYNRRVFTISSDESKQVVEQQQSNIYLKIAEGLIKEVRQKNSQIEELLIKQYKSMCDSSLSQEKVRLSLLKLGRVLRLMKITKAGNVTDNSINREKQVKEIKKVRKSQYTQQSQQIQNQNEIMFQNMSEEEYQHQFKHQYQKKSNKGESLQIRDTLQKILSRISSIQSKAFQNSQVKSIFQRGEPNANQQIEEQKQKYDNQIQVLRDNLKKEKKLYCKRFKSIAKICLNSLVMIVHLFKRLKMSLNGELHQISLIAEDFNKKYHSGQDRLISCPDLKQIKFKIYKVYNSLHQKFIKELVDLHKE